MSGLLDAFDDLKGALVAEENAEQAIAEIAADHGVNPALLRRKFVESFGSVEGYRERFLFADANAKEQAAAAKQREEAAAADARAREIIRRRLEQRRKERDPYGDDDLDRMMRRLAKDFVKDDPGFADLLNGFLDMGKRK